MTFFWGLFEAFTALFSGELQTRCSSWPWWAKVLMVVPALVAGCLTALVVWLAGTALVMAIRALFS